MEMASHKYMDSVTTSPSATSLWLLPVKKCKMPFIQQLSDPRLLLMVINPHRSALQNPLLGLHTTVTHIQGVQAAVETVLHLGSDDWAERFFFKGYNCNYHMRACENRTEVQDEKNRNDVKRTQRTSVLKSSHYWGPLVALWGQT